MKKCPINDGQDHMIQDKTNHWKVGTIVLAVSLVFGGIGYYYYQKNEKFKAEIINGKVRGNRKSRIIHLPHCPNYNDILEKNRIEFSTLAEAESRKFRMSGNCPDTVINIRKSFEQNQ